ncbi:tetratricopeptide repeat protein [Hymenobacter sp. BT190]|uniref:tetratricopeptide repeat protein n=1 Tax=Hymenobacter sp. BT190 TaxID=2763505 RepID=UPI0016516B06|nr:tetratricopeptide repeat protein [Hymenobacter sp. BT190]MBC6698928.1 tetratricopeptide repeat protein [Hymenobacter sp. BT190]
MKYAGLLLVTILGGWGSLSSIHDRNEAVALAQRAYRRADFAQAAQLYNKAVQQLGATDEAILLNLGHASTRAGQTSLARAAYGQLLTSRSTEVRSAAQQQLALLATRKGDFAQALGLLRQALQTNPANAVARYNYEVVSDYLTRRQQDPTIPPPAPADASSGTNSRPERAAGQSSAPQPRAGQDQSGQLDDPERPQDRQNPAQPQRNPNGQRDPSQSSTQPGNSASGNFRPGQGMQRSVAQGSQPGNTRGLSSSAENPATAGGTTGQPGTETATASEAQLQTQRARLQQMNLSSGQARQILEALSAAEQQYLQQLPRPATTKPDPSKPAW